MKRQPALVVLFFLCIFSFFFVFSKKVCAQVTSKEVVFEDNFTAINGGYWELVNPTSSISLNNGLLLTSNSSIHFPFVYLKDNVIPSSGDFYISITYDFPSTTYFGTGIGIGNLVPDYPVHNMSAIDSEFIYFLIWQSINDGRLFQSRLCNTPSSCSSVRTNIFSLFPDSNTHTFEFEYTKGSYKVMYDGSEISNPVFQDFMRRPSTIWFGNPEPLLTPQNWTSLRIRRVEISKILPRKIVFVPGMGASWDMTALLTGTPGNNWQIPEYVKNYDSLVKSFVNAGFVKGSDFFIFAYDWRKPLDSLADDLKEYLDNHTEQGDSVSIIGHSMGGLVARMYAQKYGVEKISKIYTFGTPHMGAIDAYGLWEGAATWDDIWWEKTLLEIATELNRWPNETRVNALRRVAPSVIDIFPTFPFLIGNGGIININEMVEKNNYLSSKNLTTVGINDKVLAYWSDDNQTRNGIRVTPRDALDIILGQWRDGRPAEPDPFTNSAGDGTVTKQSAIGPFTFTEQIHGWHGDLLANESNIKNLFQKIGIDQSFVVSSDSDTRKNAFVAALRSPGELIVCTADLIKCNENLGIYMPLHKLFILPGYSGEDLAVKIKATDLGEYSLHLGNIDENPDWKVFQGNLSNTTQTDFYGVRKNGVSIDVVEDRQPPEISIASPETKNYVDYLPPSLDYEVKDNWTKSPAVTISGWSVALGKHTVILKAEDDAGYIAEKSVSFNIVKDEKSPEVTIQNPLSGSYKPENLPSLSYTIVDDWDSTPTAEVSGYAVEEGLHTLSVKTTDRAGNSATSTVNYTVDNTPPVITITSPQPGVIMANDLTTPQYVVIDNFDANPTIKVEGWSAELGKHTLTVRATDAAGNLTQKSIDYEVVDPHPSDPDQCKKGRWMLFRFLGFRNQGDCVSFAEKLHFRLPTHRLRLPIFIKDLFSFRL